MFVDLKQALERSSRPKESPDLPLGLQLFPGGSRIGDGHTPPPPPPPPSSSSAIFSSITALEDSRDGGPPPPHIPRRTPSFLRSLNLTPFVDCDDAAAAAVAAAAKEGDLKWGLPSFGSVRKEEEMAEAEVEAAGEKEEEGGGILAARSSEKTSPCSIPSSSSSAVKDLGRRKRRSSRFHGGGVFARNLHAGVALPSPLKGDLEWELPSFQSMRKEEEEKQKESESESEKEKEKEKEKEEEETAEEDRIIAREGSDKTSPPCSSLSSSSALKGLGKMKGVSRFGNGVFAKSPHVGVDWSPKGDLEWALPSFRSTRKEEEEEEEEEKEEEDGTVARGPTDQTSPSSILSSSVIKDFRKKKSVSRFGDGVFVADSEPSEKFNTSLDLGGIFQASDEALAGRRETHNGFPSEKVHDSLFPEKTEETHNSFFPEETEKTHHSLFPEKTHHRFFSEEARSAQLLSLKDLNPGGNPTTTPQCLSDELSLWCGLVQYGESCSFRAVAGCLGDLKLGSRLRKLPSILIAHKLVDIKSFLHSLQKGTSEPVVQFTLPDGAPPEDAKSFRTMAEKLSGASESRRKDDEELQLELGRQSFSIGAYFAAAVFLQDNVAEREETEFYIIAPSVLEHVLQHWSLPTSVIMPKEVDLHDHSKLYGFFFPCIPAWSFESASDNVPGIHTLPLCLGGRDGKMSKGDGKITEGFDKLSSEMGLLSGFNLGQASVAGGFGSEAKGKEHAGYYCNSPHIEKEGSRKDGGHGFPIQADGDANWWDSESGKGLELGMMLRERYVGIPLEGQGALDVKMEEMADDIRLGPLGRGKSFSSFHSFESRVEKGETKESKKRERGHDLGCEWKPLKEAKLACEREMDSLLHVNPENKDAHEIVKGSQCDTSDMQLNRMNQPASSSADALFELTPAKVDGREVYCEFSLNGLDRESRSWLLSKQSELYLQENYGVSMMLQGDNSLPGPKLGVQSKGNVPPGPVHVKISMAISNTSEVSEGKWFVSQAAYILKAMALRGVYLKCIWYSGPVQLKSGDGAPLVSAVVKKIKGEDGKNLERIEEMTGVLIGVVLRKGVVTGGIEASSKKAATRVIGLRLKCVVRKGLLEASKQAGALLLGVADHFAKRAGGYSGDGRRKKPPLNELIPPSMAAGALPAGDCSDPSEDASPYVKRVKEAAALDGVAQEKKLRLLSNELEGAAEMGANVGRRSREKLGAFAEMAAVMVEEAPRLNVALEGLRVEEPGGDLDPDMFGRVAEYPAASDKPNPLYLTELMRNVSAPALKRLFEDIIGKYIWPSSPDSPDGGGGRKLVLDVRYVPTRGCAFVDLATTELVEFMLDLHRKRPDVFHYMKMGIGKRQQQFSEPITTAVELVDEERERGEEEEMDNRRGGAQSHLSHHSGSWSKATHSGIFRRSSEILSDTNLRDLDYAGDSERGGGGEAWPRKHRSDPEKTVYADRLPDNASESLIRRAFEKVLLENLSQAQKDALGSDGVIQEVRHIPPKYCAFVVFASEELTRLVLQLYNQDEDIFDGMRLKPHFHSRMEDLYQEEFLDQEVDVHPKGMSMDPHSPLSLPLTSLPTSHHHRGSSYEQDDPQKPRHVDYSRSSSSAHRAVAATAFKEVDRRRSVYVDRIPEKLSESLMRDIFEKVLRRLRHGCDTSHMVSQVTFFRDKFDSKKLCAFVEVRHEDATQDLIDCYHDDEEAFLGMRIRSALKYH